MTPVTAQTSDASTAVDLYTVPASKIARLDVYISERAGGTPTHTVAVVPSGETPGVEHQVTTAVALTANGTDKRGPFFLSTGDIIRVASSDANVTFTVNGYEHES